MDRSLYSSDAKYNAALKLRRPPEEYYALIHERFPTITITGEYINQKSKMNAKCDVCGYEWTPFADVLLRSKGCVKCNRNRIGKSQRKTHEQFVDELAIVNPDIEVLSRYETALTRIDCRCKICGHTWDSKASNLLSGFGCRVCGFKRGSSKQMKSTSEFIDQLSTINQDIEIIGEYAGYNRKIPCRCKLCGGEWDSIPANLVAGEGCPKCNMSHGERAIKNYLDQHGVIYEQGKKYDGLLGVNGKPLSYDFYLNKNNILIEFQGVQHERPVSLFGGEKTFEVQREHDVRKKMYADDHDIPLIEIWYYDIKNISKILNNIVMVQ